MTSLYAIHSEDTSLPLSLNTKATLPQLGRNSQQPKDIGDKQILSFRRLLTCTRSSLACDEQLNDDTALRPALTFFLPRNTLAAVRRAATPEKVAYQNCSVGGLFLSNAGEPPPADFLKIRRVAWVLSKEALFNYSSDHQQRDED